MPVNISRTPVMPFASSSGKKISGAVEVHVHIPQTGDQKFAGAVDDVGALRSLDRFLNRSDLPVLDPTDIAGRAVGSGGVDDGDVLNDQGLRGAGERKKKQFHSRPVGGHVPFLTVGVRLGTSMALVQNPDCEGRDMLEQFLNRRFDVLHRRLARGRNARACPSDRK